MAENIIVVSKNITIVNNDAAVFYALLAENQIKR